MESLLYEEDVFQPERANYMVIQRRSGEITDVWKLESAIVQFIPKAHGWRIVTNKGAVFFVAGDVEVWQIEGNINESNLWNMYHAYHGHSEQKNYKDKYTNQPPPPPPPPPKKSWLRWPYKVSVKWNW